MKCFFFKFTLLYENKAFMISNSVFRSTLFIQFEKKESSEPVRRVITCQKLMFCSFCLLSKDRFESGGGGVGDVVSDGDGACA